MAKKKEFIYYRSINIDLYNTGYHVYRDKDMGKIIDYLGPDYKDCSRHSDGQTMVMVEDSTGKIEFVVAISVDKPHVVAHEAIHAAWEVLDFFGVKVSPKNHEALTYMVQHFVKSYYDKKPWSKLYI